MLSALSPSSGSNLNLATSPTQPSGSLPRRSDSLSSSIAKPKPTSPLVQAREDAKYARSVLSTPIMTMKQEEALGAEERERRREEKDGQWIELAARMTGWVEELATLLQQAYKNQTDLETALTLTRSNLQLALANNEMLEDALKRAGGNGKDVGWRRWSEREGVRRSSSVSGRPSSVADVLISSPSPTQTSQHEQQQQQQQQQHPPQPSPSQPQPSQSRGFFNFSSLTRSNTSPTATTYTPPIDTSFSFMPSLLSSIPPHSASSSRSPSPAPGANVGLKSREKELVAELEKERAALREMAEAKAQLEDELESLSQALFEEANKMVSDANRKLAETEEELRMTMEQREALKGALIIVEGENGALRSESRQSQNQDRNRNGDSCSDIDVEGDSQIIDMHNPDIMVTQDTPTPKAEDDSRSPSRSNSDPGEVDSSRSHSPAHSRPPQQLLYTSQSQSQSHSHSPTVAHPRPRSSSLTQSQPQQPHTNTNPRPRSRSSSITQAPTAGYSRPTSVSSIELEIPAVTLPKSSLQPGSFWSPVTPSSDGYGSTPITPSDEADDEAGSADDVYDGGGGGGGATQRGAGRRLGGQAAEVRYIPRMGLGVGELSPIAEAMSPPLTAGFGSMVSPGSATSQYSAESAVVRTPRSAVFALLSNANANIHTPNPATQATDTSAPSLLPIPATPEATEPPPPAPPPSSSSLPLPPPHPSQTPATPQFLLYPPSTPNSLSSLTPGTFTPTTSPSPGPQSALFPSSSTQRWSIIPKTPRSRVAVQSEFEKAMERMRGIVGDAGEESDSGEVSGGAEGGEREREREGASEGVQQGEKMG